MSTDEVREIKAYVKAVVGGYVVADNMGHCVICGEWKDLRLGHCFTCAFQECPLEVCNYKRMVFNAKRERVLKDSKYLDRQSEIQYCNRSEGMCDEAKASTLCAGERTQ